MLGPQIPATNSAPGVSNFCTDNDQKTSAEVDNHLQDETLSDSQASDTPHACSFPPNEHPALRAERFFLELFSGSSFPLTTAFRLLGLATLYPMDSDRLVKLAISQLVGLCWAAPPCRHYSLCKLTGLGPPPCRDF